MNLADLARRDEEEKGRNNAMYNGDSGGGSIGIQQPTGNSTNPNPNNQFQNESTDPLPQDAPQVILYQDGFIIQHPANSSAGSNREPEFRPISDPFNKKFIDDVKSGVVPQELAAIGNSVHVGVLDRSTMKYPGIGGALNQANGSGPAGSSSAGVTSNQQQNRPNQINLSNVDMASGLVSGPTANNNALQNAEIRGFDPNKPKTTINIRFGDGRKKVKEFNLDQHTRALYDFIVECCETTEFTMSTGFPPAVISMGDLEKSIKEMDLERSLVTVKQK